MPNLNVRCKFAFKLAAQKFVTFWQTCSCLSIFHEILCRLTSLNFKFGSKIGTNFYTDNISHNKQLFIYEITDHLSMEVAECGGWGAIGQGLIFLVKFIVKKQKRH